MRFQKDRTYVERDLTFFITYLYLYSLCTLKRTKSPRIVHRYTQSLRSTVKVRVIDRHREYEERRARINKKNVTVSIDPGGTMQLN